MKNNLEIKKLLFEACNQFCNTKLATISKNLNDIQEALTTETKSSAGDKHETGRAMLQLEREQLGTQFSEILKLKESLNRIDISKVSKSIGFGSVVFTTEFHYFIAISAGELSVNNKKFYAISPSTPIGKLLLGKVAGDGVNFKEQQFKIVSIT
jgi:transcription elongation GreA/GreB family factor